MLVDAAVVDSEVVAVVAVVVAMLVAGSAAAAAAATMVDVEQMGEEVDVELDAVEEEE